MSIVFWAVLVFCIIKIIELKIVFYLFNKIKPDLNTICLVYKIEKLSSQILRFFKI